ncbi:hypothetical protein ABPG75_004656 [Micractinium tetrahymenae]
MPEQLVDAADPVPALPPFATLPLAAEQQHEQQQESEDQWRLQVEAAWLQARDEDEAAWEARRAQRQRSFQLEQALAVRDWQLRRQQDQRDWEQHRALQQALFESWCWQHRQAACCCEAGAEAAASPSHKRRREEEEAHSMQGSPESPRPRLRLQSQGSGEAEQVALCGAEALLCTLPVPAEEESRCGGGGPEHDCAAHGTTTALSPGAAAVRSSAAELSPMIAWDSLAGDGVPQWQLQQQQPSLSPSGPSSGGMLRALCPTRQAGTGPAALLAAQQRWCESAQQLLAQLKGRRLSARQLATWKEQQQWLLAQKQAWEALLSAGAAEAAELLMADAAQAEAEPSSGVVSAAHAAAAEDWWLDALDC